jgi:exodeoxyribonuclease V alpha subunit
MATDIVLTDEQNQVVDMVRNNAVSMCIGGPGVGKTTVTKEVIAAAYGLGMQVGLCAPSGKAAKRMYEATGYGAMTIHKLLDAHMEHDEFVFGFDELNPMHYDFIIADETSMISNDLMADLLRAVKTGTKMLFVGDQDQLPSVGPGSVLRDLLASQVIPHVELTKIHRNAGDIVKACHEIKHGRSYKPSPELDLEAGHNLRHIEAPTEAFIQTIIKDLVVNKLPLRGYDPVWDIQVISPVNERTSISCKALNEELQKALNPNPPVEETEFRVGDKAIQIKNNGKVKTPDGDPEYIVNGDLCRIEKIEGGQMIAKFFDPDRRIVLAKKNNDFLLAYTITCHRFQGSEAPVVIIPVHEKFGFFVDRPWIYTAISRARKICITVGQFKAIEKAIQRVGSRERITRLKERLIETEI